MRKKPVEPLPKVLKPVAVKPVAGKKSVRGLTPKQLAYLAGRIAGKSALRSVSDAGYANCPSKVIGSLSGPAFHAAVHAAMESGGVTMELLVKTLGETLVATEEKAFVTKDGAVVYANESPLPEVRLKAAAVAFDVMGISGRARQAVAEEKRAGDQVNVLVLAQRYEHLSIGQLEEAMQLMLVGQFEGSSLALPAVESKEGPEHKIE